MHDKGIAPILEMTDDLETQINLHHFKDSLYWRFLRESIECINCMDFISFSFFFLAKRVQISMLILYEN